MSQAMSCAKPQASEATRNITSETRKIAAGSQHITEFAEHRQQHGAREGVADDNPAHLLNGAQFPGNGGKRGGHHGVVQGPEEGDGEQGDDEETESQRRKWHSGLPERSGRRRDVVCLGSTVTPENGSGRNPGAVTHDSAL